MKIVIHWQPELPGFRSSTRNEDGLRELFDDAEANRILGALATSNGMPVTLTVSGYDAGYLDLDFVDAEFRVLVDAA
jgi:hypothetical protein